MEEREMHPATCSECGAACEVPFKPIEGKPIRCKECYMKMRNSGGSFNRFDGPRQMHKAKCTECKADCEVPFKPTEGKPVLCKACYIKSKDG